MIESRVKELIVVVAWRGRKTVTPRIVRSSAMPINTTIEEMQIFRFFELILRHFGIFIENRSNKQPKPWRRATREKSEEKVKNLAECSGVVFVYRGSSAPGL